MSAKPFNFGSCQPDMLPDGNGGLYCQGGLSIRDWFAGMALQGFLVAEPTMPDAKAAQWSYGIADAMLAAREGKGDSQ